MAFPLPSPSSDLKAPNEMYSTACNSFDTLMTCLVLYSETGTCSQKIAESFKRTVAEMLQ